MKTFFVMVGTETKMLARMPLLWLIIAFIIALWVFDLSPSLTDKLNLIEADNAIIYRDELGNPTIDFAAEAKKAIQTKPFSFFYAFSASDRISLWLSLCFGFIGCFSLVRERQVGVAETVYAKQVTTATLFLSKMAALVFLMGVITITSFGLVVVSGQIRAASARLVFHPGDFLPFLFIVLVTIFFGISFDFLVSLILKSGTGALVLHVLYWFLCITNLHMLKNPPDPRLLIFWIIRFVEPMSPKISALISANKELLLFNRSLYLGLFAMFSLVGISLLDRDRQSGRRSHHAS